MKSAIHCCCLLIALLIPVLLEARPDNQVILASDDWCPYNCVPGSKKPGYIIELARNIFKQHGYTVLYRDIPWARTLRATALGEVDGAVGAVSGNYGNTIIGKESLGRDETVLVLRQDFPFHYQSAQDLTALKLAIIANYTYDTNGPIDQQLNQIKANNGSLTVIHSSKGVLLLMDMLLQKRVDAFLENRQVATYTATQQEAQDKIRVVPTGGYDDIYIAFTPTLRGKKLLTLFDDGVRQMKASGELEALMGSYGLVPGW